MDLHFNTKQKTKSQAVSIFLTAIQCTYMYVHYYSVRNINRARILEREKNTKCCKFKKRLATPRKITLFVQSPSA